MKPVSVVLPAYNAERYIGAAIRSILRQTHSDLELIVIDDGSTDRTADIVAGFDRVESRVNFVSRPNKGLVDTLNEGLGLVSCDYVARMDADDISYPGRIALQVEALQGHEGAAMCATGFDYMYAGQFVSPGKLPIASGRQFGIVHLFHTGLVHPTVMYNMSHLETLGRAYRPEYKHAEDFDLFRRVTSQFELCVVPERLVAWRQHHKSVRTTHQHVMLRNHFRIVEEQLLALGIDDVQGAFAPWAETGAFEAHTADAERTIAALRRLVEYSFVDDSDQAVYNEAFGLFFLSLYRSWAARLGERQAWQMASDADCIAFVNKKDRLARDLDWLAPVLSIRSLLDGASIVLKRLQARVGGRRVLDP